MSKPFDVTPYLQTEPLPEFEIKSWQEQFAALKNINAKPLMLLRYMPLSSGQALDYRYCKD